MLNTDRQELVKSIIESKKRNHLIVAAAGSGKTSTLVDVLNTKISNKLIDPLKEKIIVFTFTNNAAEELAIKISNLFDKRKEIMNHIFIGTIHSWCEKYLQENAVLSNTKIIDELEQYQLILRIYLYLEIENNYDGLNKFKKIEKFVKDLELFYNEHLSFDDLNFSNAVKTCIEKYCSFIATQRLLDFGSLIRNSIEHLKTTKDQFKVHIFIDEYQDLNSAQVKLLKELLKKNKNNTIIAVGDPRQAIYQWRGSDLQNLLSFPNDFEDAEIHSMNMNFRSRPGIIKFANIIAKDMDFQNKIPIKDMTVYEERNDNKISVIHLKGNIPQEIQILEIISKLEECGIKYSDIAILMRSVVNHSEKLMELLHINEKPFYSPNMNLGITFIQDFIVSIIDLIEIMDNDMEPANKAEEEELNEKINENLEYIKNYCPNCDKIKIHKAISEWFKKLKTKNMKGLFPNEAYNFRQQFFDFCEEVGFQLQLENDEIIDGFSAITQIMRSIEEIYRRRFINLTLRSSPVEVFINNLRWQIEHEIERWTETGLNIKNKDYITISTIHAAKGLEWPVVIIPFLWQNRFPVKESSHGTSFPDEIAKKYGTTKEDERRLWYVAVTRSRDRLYFLSGDPENRRKESEFTYSCDIRKCSEFMIETENIEIEADLSNIIPHIKETFFKIGVSDLLLLLECPFEFYLRKIKAIEVPVSSKLGAGNVIHKIIERIIKDSPKNINKLIDEEAYFPLAEIPYEKKLKENIKKRIETLTETGILNDINFSELQFNIVLDNYYITGMIDALKNRKEKYIVIDWKNSIHDALKPRYINQILIYSWGLNFLGKEVVKGIIYNLKEITDDGSILMVDITQEKIEKLKIKLSKEIENINAIKIIPNPCKDSCSICDILQICPNYNSKFKKTI